MDRAASFVHCPNNLPKEALLTEPWISLLESLSEHHIFIPRIPMEIRSGLVQLDERTWSTRNDVDTVGMYTFDAPIREVLETSVSPYFAIANTGHGLNSNTYTLCLVAKRAAIFLQFGYGPVYTNYMKCRIDLTRGFLMLERLIQNLPEGDGPVDFVLAYSDLRGSVLLERDVEAKEQRTRLLREVDGWRPIDVEEVALADGKPPTLDGQGFEWQEPMDFKIAAAKFLATMKTETKNGR
jgi:hypothetical protein